MTRPNVRKLPAGDGPAAAGAAAPLTIAVVGAGARFNAYHRKYILKNPQRVRIVAVAEPDPQRRRELAAAHGIGPDRCFESFEQVAARPNLARAVVNTTMDLLHHRSAMALLTAGYDMLLEKPIAPGEQAVRELIGSAVELGRTIMICHGMRYQPFYERVKEVIDEGRIGRIMSVAASEYVAYDHAAGAYVRGKWRNTAVAAPMILAKCCHDLDMIVWLMSGVRPRRVASFGSLMHFRPKQAPPGSALRCADGCEIERSCAYSAVTLNLRRVSPELARDAGPAGQVDDATVAQDLEALRRDSPYGRCVWHCDNDVVDHQTVIIEFENGATATLNMIGNAARATRDIHVIGTEGELQGDLKEGLLHVRRFNPYDLNRTFTQETIDVPHGPDNHGGADELLFADFVALMLGEPTSKARTRIEDSLTGHLLGFAAERARVEGRVVDL